MIALENRVMPGSGTLLAATPLGHTVSAAPAGGKWNHPFKPTLYGAGLRFALGLVDGIEPTIGGVPISGGPGGAKQPTLAIEAGTANAAGESWACIELQTDEKGDLAEGSAIEIVHRGEPFVSRGPVARHPVAVVLWKNGRPMRALAVTHFNLRHVAVRLPAGFYQHYFL